MDKLTKAFVISAISMILGWFASVVIVLTISSRQEKVKAQELERSYPETKLWTIYRPDRDYHVDVIDTAGVCIYLYQNFGIATVSKKDLPLGTGCQ